MREKRWWAGTNVQMNWLARILVHLAIWSCWRDPNFKHWKETSFRIFDEYERYEEKASARN